MTSSQTHDTVAEPAAAQIFKGWAAGPDGEDCRGWASPEARAAARADLERRAARHEEQAAEALDYAADLRMQADELADDHRDGM